MKVYELAAGQAGYTLAAVERPAPSVAAKTILVKVRATSLNYRDLLIRDGRYGVRSISGLIPISDGAGEVVAVGDEVSGVKPGDRVAGCFFQNWISGKPTKESLRTDLGGGRDGILAELVPLQDTGYVKIPEHLTFEEAACLPCAGLTAWNALVTRGEIREGETVLVLGTGGVSIFALQFAVALGAKSIVTSSAESKLERALSMGAWKTINYKSNPDWEKAVLSATEGRGVDHVVEVGGPGTLGKSVACAAIGGHIAQIGVLAGSGDGFNPVTMMMKNIRLDGIFVGSRSDFEAMNTLISTHKLRPVIDRVFPFEEASAAYDYLRSGAHFGKVVIRGCS